MQLEALWELLPPTLEAATPQLLYSSNYHGYALQRMFEQCDWANGHVVNHGAIDHAGMLLIVQTTSGNIVGGFCDRRLEPHGGGDVKYSGRRGCFVFVFAPGLEVGAKAYRWSGLNEMFWRALRPQGTPEQRAQGKARPCSLRCACDIYPRRATFATDGVAASNLRRLLLCAFPSPLLVAETIVSNVLLVQPWWWYWRHGRRAWICTLHRCRRTGGLYSSM